MTQYFKAEHLSRQSGLIPMTSLDKSITIIGAGAVGSWSALSLVKMGFTNLTVWDYDTVDVVNMSSQIFRFKDIGKPKVVALQEIIKDFTNIDIKIVNDKYTGTTITSDFLISAVDSMSVRKQIWDSNKNVGFVKTLIDGRMGAESLLLYVMNPSDSKDIVSYEKTLYTDEDSVQAPCTMKSTAYCATILSGLICAQIKSVATENPYSRITQFDIPKGSYLSWQK